MPDLRERVQEQSARVREIRRELHRIPEVGFNEHKTSGYVAGVLRELGVPVQTGVAGTGVVGVLEGAFSGKTLMIRADMDALPVTEETGLSFGSTHHGTMHACGHDAHMAMALGAAAALRALSGELRGCVKFVFQPAEEGPGGARPLIEAGVLEHPNVDFCVGCHLWPGMPEGQIGVKAGPIMAAMDRFDLKIAGKGGHGAMPHLCVDALEVGTQVVAALQRIVSRKMNPLSPTVVTVGTFRAGRAFNVIPAEADLSGTTRTFDRSVWQSWPERLEQVIRGVCQSMGAQYVFRYTQGYPPTVNDPAMAEVVRRCAEAVVGPGAVVEPESTMGGEDMSFYLERVPGCFFFLGVGREGGTPLHSSTFDFDEGVLATGVETLSRVALELLG